jgi:hypothetical protein
MKNELFTDKNLKEFGNDYIKELTLALKRAGKRSSGKLISSLDYKVKEEGKTILLLLEANDYLTNVDEGRRKGKYPPIKEIAKWARVKGIPQSAVFPIARKIYRFGIKPTNVIADTNKKMLSTSKLSKYEKIMVSNIEDNIEQTFKNNIDK